MSKQFVLRWLVAGAIASVPQLALAETYYGPEIVGLARQTIDVMKLHQHVIQQQLALDETPAFFELALRSMPATLQFDDGGRTSVGITRAGLSTGFGFGKPRTGLAAFAGIQADLVATTDFPNFFTAKDGFEVGQGTFYAGLAAHGFQATYGMMMETSGRGLNPQGYFTRKQHGFRPGTPPEITETGTVDERSTTYFTLSQAEGITLGATLASLGGEASMKLAALRGELAPARLIDRLGLRETLGVPGIGFERYSAEIDYWGDRFSETRRMAEALANGLPGAQAPSPGQSSKSESSETWEIPIFLDDIAGTGLRARVVPQVKPRVKLRAVEAAYRYRRENLKAGLRAFAFQRGESFNASAETYVALRPDLFKYFSIFGVPWLTVSYSYNAPESATFLPIPNAHVFGAQWVYGPPEMGRPLVPLVAEHASEKDEERE